MTNATCALFAQVENIKPRKIKSDFRFLGFYNYMLLTAYRGRLVSHSSS